MRCGVKMDCKSVGLFSFIFLLLVVSMSDEKVISPEHKKIYHDIVSGLGLYNNFKQIIELTTSNFHNNVYSKDNPRTWLVEFYNSWCGHCHRFAPVYKSLAADIYNWRDIVAIGAVDCSNDTNNQLCRDYEIMYYPSLKLFPIHSAESFLGTSFTKSTEAEMKLEIVKQIEKEVSHSTERKNLNFTPYNEPSLNFLWFGTSLEIEYTFLVIQDPEKTPHLASEIALDFYRVKNVRVRSVLSDNKGLLLQLPTVVYPSVFVTKRNNEHELLTIHNTLNHSEGIYSAISKYLNKRGIRVPEKEKFDITKEDFDMSDIMRTMSMQEEIKKKLHSKDLSDVVFQVDIENAVRYSLYHEIGGHKTIEGAKLTALKNYLIVLSKYFPFGTDGRNFLDSIKNDVLPRDVVHGYNFSSLAKTMDSFYNDNVFLPKQDWIGCKGSQPQFRGYPCGLWTMFHTLTVHADNKKDDYPDSNPQEVLNAMVGYIKYFFGCSECSQHFQQMAVTMSGNVSSLENSIVWLWKSHNAVNKRLAGDVTEDPEHKKIQFPSTSSCPKCRDSVTQAWDTQEVYEFLKSMYMNISYIQWSDISLVPSTAIPKTNEVSYSKRLRHDNIGNDNSYDAHDENGANKTSGDFNLFDISLCVALYISSVVILLLVCIKFVMKKSHKKKNSFDLYHGKV